MYNVELYRQKFKEAKKLNSAYSNAKKILELSIKHLTLEYDNKMNFHVKLDELYRLREEYNNKIKEYETELNKLENAFHSAEAILELCSSLPNKDYDACLLDINNTLKEYMPKGAKKGILSKWEKETKDIDNHEFKNMKSRINNLSGLALKRLNEAKLLQYKIMELNKLFYMSDARSKLSKTTNYQEMVNIIVDSRTFCSSMNAKRDKSSRNYKVYLQTFNTYKGKELSLDIAEYFEKHIEEVINPEFKHVLDNLDEYDKLIGQYDVIKDTILKEESLYNKVCNKVKLNILSEIKNMVNELHIINGLNKSDTGIHGKLSEKSSLEEIIEVYNKLNMAISKGKNKFINDSYKSILYFYIGNGIMDKFPSKVYNAYIRYCNNPSYLDECLDVIKKAYSLCCYSVEYNLNDEEEYKENSIKMLCDKIDYIFNLYSRYGADIPGDIVDMYMGKDNLKNNKDIISLFDLYQRINKISIFNDEKEVKFTR